MFNCTESFSKTNKNHIKSYKKFSNEAFILMISKIHFFNWAQAGKTILLKNSKKLLMPLLNNHRWKKDVTANQFSFVNKTITKELGNGCDSDKFLNTKSEIDRKAHKKKRNYCVTLIGKAKQPFLGNINTTDVTNDETFGEQLSLFHR